MRRAFFLLPLALCVGCIPSASDLPFTAVAHSSDADTGTRTLDDGATASGGPDAEAGCMPAASDCDDHARCEDSDGSYSCTCIPGYDGDGTSCLPGSQLVLNVQRFTLTLTDDVPVTRTLDWPVGLNAIPFATKRMSGAGWSPRDQSVDVYLVDEGTAVEAVRNGSRGEVTVAVAVAELNPNLAQVRTGTFTLRRWRRSDVVSLEPALDGVDTAFATATATASWGVDSAASSSIAVAFPDSQSLLVSRHNDAGELSGHWYVVAARNASFSVHHIDIGDVDGFGITKPTPTVPLDRGAIIYSHEMQQPSTGGEVLVDCWRTTDREVRCERGMDGGKVKDIMVQLIDFRTSATVRRDEFELGTATSVALDPPVDPTSSLVFGISVTNIGEALAATLNNDAGYATSDISITGDSVVSTRSATDDTLQRHFSVVEF